MFSGYLFQDEKQDLQKPTSKALYDLPLNKEKCRSGTICLILEKKCWQVRTEYILSQNLNICQHSFSKIEQNLILFSYFSENSTNIQKCNSFFLNQQINQTEEYRCYS